MKVNQSSKTIVNKELKTVDVSIIIVSWNTRQITWDCLKSVYTQPKRNNYEVIVVDNASSDDSVNMIRRDFPDVIIIENKDNRGFAAANNQGIEVAKGRYILLLNSDTIVLENVVQKTMLYADKHPEAAVVGCQVLENAHAVQMTCFRFPSVVNLLLAASGLARLFKHDRFFGRENMLWWKRDCEREVDVVSGMFMLVRRKAVDEVGVMDEGFFIYCEEADWCYRFKQAGWKMLFWPGAKIIHVDGGSHSTDQVTVKMFVQKQKSLLIFIRKHRGLFKYWLGCLILSLSFCSRVFILGLLTASKKIMGGKADRETASIRKHWAALKFCTFNLEPVQDN